MNAIRSRTLLTAILLGGLAGCAHTPSNAPIAPRRSVSGFAAPCDCGPGTSRLPRRLSPSPAAIYPGASVPGQPLPSGGETPQTGQPPPIVPPSENPPADTPSPRGNLPPGDEMHAQQPRWRPSPDVSIKPFMPPIERDPRATLKAPQVGESERPVDPPKNPNVLPVDVPQFAFARKQVASGQKPFADGVTWLREKGYRTVLFTRAPGEDDSAAKRQFTDKGFRYLSLEVSPITLNRDIIDEFNKIVADQGNLPLYVYDRDSSLLGGLWYLHFRLHESFDHEKAAIKAGELGLNIDADGGPHKEMWLAVQRYLQMSKPTSRPSPKVHTAVWLKSR